jgi:hypothetical protein
MLCEACGTSAATKTWTDRQYRVPESHRLCETCHDLVSEERRSKMGANKRTPENAKIANAILQALFDEDGLTVQQVRDAISAESDEYQTVNGVLTSLGKRDEIVRTNGRYFLTALGRKQVAPADAPPGPVKPAVAAPLPAPAPARNVEETSKENVVTYPLSVLTDLVAQDDAASLAGREREHAAEEREAREALTAIRVIEAAFPGLTGGLSPAAVADRVVDHMSIAATVARESAIVTTERDNALATLRASIAERDKAVADLSVAQERIAEQLDTITELRARVREAESLRKQLDAARDVVTTAHAVIDSHRTAPPADADGHYWTEQGGRHVLSVLRPVEVATIETASNGVLYWKVPKQGEFFEGQPNTARGDTEDINLARKLAELAAGVAHADGRLAGGVE